MRYQYIDDPDTLVAAIERIRHSSVLGVDTEAAGYHRFHDRISLLQISSPEENILIDPLAIEDLSPLSPLFLDENIEKIFHDADFDLRILHRDAGLEIHSLFDTQIAAAFAGERKLGLGAIVEKYLGISLPKAYQRADWAERPLTAGMKEYAATDTAHLPPLRDRLIESLTRLDRLAWAREEFERREATRWVEDETANDDAFLRVKGARDLQPRGLAILREIFRWRDDVGRERDQATFRIMSNQTMIEIALTAPTSKSALLGIGGISAGLVERRWREIVEAVRSGLAVPDDELPRFPPVRRWERDPTVEETAERLRQVRNDVAQSLDLDSGFLMSRNLLEEIARKKPASLEELAELPDVRRWQIEALGSKLMNAIS